LPLLFTVSSRYTAKIYLRHGNTARVFRETRSSSILGICLHLARRISQQGRIHITKLRPLRNPLHVWSSTKETSPWTLNHIHIEPEQRQLPRSTSQRQMKRTLGNIIPGAWQSTMPSQWQIYPPISRPGTSQYTRPKPWRRSTARILSVSHAHTCHTCPTLVTD
jgi:hypothetical protein